MIKEYAPFAILVCAVVTAAISLFGEDSYSKLVTLRKALEVQRGENRELSERVAELRHEVWALREDERALEKAARNQLGLARPNEEIFIFEKRPPPQLSRRGARDEPSEAPGTGNPSRG